jgi:hypothetical protein
MTACAFLATACTPRPRNESPYVFNLAIKILFFPREGKELVKGKDGQLSEEKTKNWAVETFV